MNFAAVFGASLCSGYALPACHPENGNPQRQPAELPPIKSGKLSRQSRPPLIIAFWAAATMTVGHLLFAAVTTAYIVVGILLEERDLVALFGDDYRRYKDRVSMLVPWRKSA